MNEHTILFCRPGPESELEDRFELEADTADAMDLETCIINADLVVDGEAERACENVPTPLGSAVYPRQLAGPMGATWMRRGMLPVS